MSPQFLIPAIQPSHSFSVRRDKSPAINNRWHYHSELELIYFKEGSGIQFIGDNVSRFKAGDIVLLGSRVPHFWRFDEVYFKDDNHAKAESVVLHFREDFWGATFLNLPENAGIKQIIMKSARGLLVSGKCKEEIAVMMEEMAELKSHNRVLSLIKILLLIAESDEPKMLCSNGYKPIGTANGDRRINAVCEYSFNHFKRRISLTEIAAVANVSPHSFGRFFKSRTRRTYSWFITEIRVAHACKLLISDDFDNLKQLAIDSGFHTYDRFFKSFKMITGQTPSAYQRVCNKDRYVNQ
jgi:AraC-like DNA-binding protein